MEEKKLTDEEIVKALDKTKQALANISPEDDDYDKLLTVKTIVDYCHNLIHRQKAEIERFAKVEMDLIGKIADKSAEIERLKKVNEELYYNGLNENTARFEDMKKIERLQDINEELQKKVDEFVKIARVTDTKKLIEGIKEQAVKDAAPVAINRFINQLHIDGVLRDEGDLGNELRKVKVFVLKRYYGVEVE